MNPTVPIVMAVLAVIALVSLVVLIMMSRSRRKAAEQRVPLSLEAIERVFVRVLSARVWSDRARRLRWPVLWSCVAATVVVILVGLFVDGARDVLLAVDTVVLFAALVVVLAAPILRLVEEFHASLLTTDEELAAELRHRIDGDG